MTDETDNRSELSDHDTPEQEPAFRAKDIFEDEAPSKAQPFTVQKTIRLDHETPKTDPTYKTRKPAKPPTHDQSTRKWIALIVLFPTVAFYAAALAGLMLHWVDRDDLTAIVAAISPFQALAAAVIGFYFAKKDDETK